MLVRRCLKKNKKWWFRALKLVSTCCRRALAYGKVWAKGVRNCFSVMFPYEHSSVVKNNSTLGSWEHVFQMAWKKKKKNARSYRQDMTGVKKSKREHPATRNIIKILAYKKNHKRLHMVGNSKTDTNNAFYRTRKESHLAKLQLLHKNVRSCLASGHNHLTRLQ